jgi:transposase
LTKITSNSAGESSPRPTEVKPRVTRRRFSAEYKRAILTEADACTRSGELGALLRREGLYSSHLSKWREQRSRGELQGLAPKKRGPKPAAKSESDNRVRELERENEKLRKRAERAEALVEVQKKLSELWEVTLPTPDDEKNS